MTEAPLPQPAEGDFQDNHFGRCHAPRAPLALLLFSLMGPIGVIPAFAAATAGLAGADRLRIACYSALIAVIALSLSVFVGTAAMVRVGTSPASMIMAAGLILTLTALRNMLSHAPAAREKGGPVSLWMRALTPITVPGIVTPVAVAVLIIFTTFFPAQSDRLTILVVACAMMGLNLLAMLAAHWFMRRIGIAPLLLLGAVFGVLQVALGIEMFVSGVARSAAFH